MRFTVEGADRQSGEERIVEIDAANESDAEGLATQHGLLVSAVRATDAPVKVRSLSEEYAARLIASVPEPLDYTTRGPKSQPAIPAPAPLTPATAVRAEGSFLGRLFSGSLLSLLARPWISVGEDHVDLMAAAGFFSRYCEHISIARIASVRHLKGVFWDGISIESSGGADLIEIVGLRKCDAEKVVAAIRAKLAGGHTGARQDNTFGTGTEEGPGRYRIIGVDRESKMDTEWTVGAASRENARVKAELEGIVVTAVNRIGDAE
jgi:hypothetical protein